MNKKIKRIPSLFLLLVFFFPTVAKLEHHHDNFKCNAKNEKHLHVYHASCNICSFEFSAFISGIGIAEIRKEIPLDRYCISYNSVDHSTLSKYSFLLRAPPFKQS